jgi:hypothetical protein
LSNLRVVWNIPFTSRYPLDPQALSLVSAATTFPMSSLYCSGVMMVNLLPVSAYSDIRVLPTFMFTHLFLSLPVPTLLR